MARTFRTPCPTYKLSKDEFYTKEYMVNAYKTYEKYLKEIVSDKYYRRTPSSDFKRIINRKYKSKIKSHLKRKFIEEDYDNITVPLNKKTVLWIWY